MYKVLLVDDEAVIREGLKTIISWEKYGFEVCATAADGREGLHEMEKCKPELAIIDIKMPVMNGIEMVEEIKARGDECKIIILTAYSDFSYAQKFIELGVDSYVLKPVEQADLIEKLIKIKNAIEDERENKQGIDASIMLSRDKIIEGFVTKSIDEAMMEKYQKQYNLNLPWHSYMVGLIDIGKEYIHEMKLKKDIKKSIEAFVSENLCGYVFDIGIYIGILFKSIPEHALTRVLKTLQDKISSIYGIVTSASVGKKVDCANILVESYTQAHDLLEQKFLYGHKQIIIGNGDKDYASKDKEICREKEEVSNETGTGEVDDAYLEQLAKKLQEAIYVNNTAIINDFLEEMRERFIRLKIDEDTIKLNYTGLYLMLINNMTAFDDALNKYTCDNSLVLGEIVGKTSLQELHGYMKYKLISLSESLNTTCYKRTVQKVLSYIERNYQKDIKLENLAAMFSYNRDYLGKLIKSSTGLYFNTYLDRVRMEKAKKLLEKGYKVYEVAEKVGICDIDYFYKKFRKYTGEAPTAFRKK